jgi:pimeloyl-ACP methyl ester carboxylesterase
MPVARVNDVELSFDDRGGDGVPLLLVCGTNMQAAMWDGFGRPGLDAAGYRTIAFDNRGIPPSEVATPPYTTEQMADDAIGLLEHLELDRAFVMGASLGANIVQAMSLKRPDLVRAAVLAVGGGNFSSSGRLGLQLAVAAMRAGGEVRELAWKSSLLDATLAPAQRHDDDAIAFVLDLLGDSFLTTSNWDGLLGQMEANLAWAEEDHLSELVDMQPPVLLIGNEFDNNFSVRGREAAATTIPNSSLFVLEGAPHLPLDPAAAETTQAEVLSFLAAH